MPWRTAVTTRARAWAAETGGVLLAVALAMVSLRHVLSTPRVWLLWYDADSVLLPLVARSLRHGLPFEWLMSPTLFFFPEIPVYLACAAVTGTPQQALALNGVLILVGVYALVRFAAGELMPGARRFQRVAASVGAMIGLTAVLLTESSSSAHTLEIASLVMLTTYYYGAFLAVLAVAALTLRVVRIASAEVPRLAIGALVVMAVVAGATTMSDPLFVPWSAAPVVITVAVLAASRRIPVRPAIAISAALVVGSVVGWVVRAPFGRFVGMQPDSYVQPALAGTTLQYFASITDQMAATAAGDAELLLLLLGFVVGVGGMVWAWRVRTARTVLVATTLSVVTTVVLCVGVVLAGSETPRYLLPLVATPLIATVAVAELFRTRVHRTRMRSASPPWRLLGALVAVGVLAAGAAVAPSTVREVATARYDNVACLDRWAGGRHVEGVGQFWTVRPLEAYSTSDVELLQVQDTLEIYPWLVNLAEYRRADPTFVVVGSGDVWHASVEDELGAPASITECTGYDIFDYAGTSGARTLRSIVQSSADDVRAEQGYPQ